MVMNLLKLHECIKMDLANYLICLIFHYLNLDKFNVPLCPIWKTGLFTIPHIHLQKLEIKLFVENYAAFLSPGNLYL